MADHRSLTVWQKAHEVTRWVIQASVRDFRPPVRIPFFHLQTAVLAVQLHIARGHALRSTRTFRRHLKLAYAAAIESVELLRVMEETHLLPSADLAGMLQAMDGVRGELLSLIRQYRHYR